MSILTQKHVADCRTLIRPNSSFRMKPGVGGLVGWLFLLEHGILLSHSLFLLLQAEDGLLNPFFFCVSYGLV